eukprot:GDKH01005659.1.p4 GENE.GDKH01005659.1~~GDKH01005659.1.p4  ORF type:complete len:62 (+),score=2.62 GDKH01005659.1:103-288(+)
MTPLLGRQRLLAQGRDAELGDGSCKVLWLVDGLVSLVYCVARACMRGSALGFRHTTPDARV